MTKYIQKIYLHFFTYTDVPGSPQTVSVTSLNPSSLTVSWTAPLANQQFGPLLRYKVSCSAPGTSRLYETPNSSTFSRLVNGLFGCISYNCCVSAINAVGDGTKKCRSASTREDSECIQSIAFSIILYVSIYIFLQYQVLLPGVLQHMQQVLLHSSFLGVLHFLNIVMDASGSTASMWLNVLLILQ